MALFALMVAFFILFSDGHHASPFPLPTPHGLVGTDGVGHFNPQGALSQHRGANSLLRWVLLRSRCQFSLLDHQTLHSHPCGLPALAESGHSTPQLSGSTANQSFRHGHLGGLDCQHEQHRCCDHHLRHAAGTRIFTPHLHGTGPGLRILGTGLFIRVFLLHAVRNGLSRPGLAGYASMMPAPTASPALTAFYAMNAFHGFGAIPARTASTIQSFGWSFCLDWRRQSFPLPGLFSMASLPQRPSWAGAIHGWYSSGLRSSR